jgi:hypothetical protein
MPLFDKHNVIFIHIPKTGGTTISRMFGLEHSDRKDIFYHHDGEVEWDHASARLIKSSNFDVYNKSDKFTFVRNPYDRVVSEFFFKKGCNDDRIIDCSNIDFKDYVNFLYNNFENILSMKQCEKSHFLPQSHFVLDDVKIFYFENILNNIKSICRMYNLEIYDKIENKSQHEHYSSYYDKKLKNKIYDLYYEDFKIFNYDP